MFTDYPPEQIAAACEACAAEVLAEAGAVAPPVDSFALAKKLGIAVVQGRDASPRAQRVAMGGRPGGETILLAEEPRPERRQWAVAHELGEVFAERVFDLLGAAPREEAADAREWVANRLAGLLLLPPEWFVPDGRRCGWDLAWLKRRYATASHELIARQMLLAGPAAIVTLFDGGRVTWRRGSGGSGGGWGRPPRLADAEERCWRRCRSLGEAVEIDALGLPSGVASVRCWPVHEPGWEREILLTLLGEAW
ncbi:MAG: ImmA/IrrE family metallo-endopeptidase [Planctomycetota bacterium]